MPFLKRKLKCPRHARQAGFTILELLVVLAILGLLVGMVAPAAMRQLGGAKNKIAQQSITRITESLDIYKLDVGSYPTTEQGLQALITQPNGMTNWMGPYLKPAKMPLDPWGRPFLYRSPSERPNHAYDVYSYGESGQASGEKDAASIINE